MSDEELLDDLEELLDGWEFKCRVETNAIRKFERKIVWTTFVR